MNLGQQVLMPVLAGEIPDKELFALFVSKVRPLCPLAMLAKDSHELLRAAFQLSKTRNATYGDSNVL